jgi:hypothetical protein
MCLCVCVCQCTACVLILRSRLVAMVQFSSMSLSFDTRQLSISIDEIGFANRLVVCTGSDELERCHISLFVRQRAKHVIHGIHIQLPNLVQSVRARDRLFEVPSSCCAAYVALLPLVNSMCLVRISTLPCTESDTNCNHACFDSWKGKTPLWKAYSALQVLYSSTDSGADTSAISETPLSFFKVHAAYLLDASEFTRLMLPRIWPLDAGLSVVDDYYCVLEVYTSGMQVHSNATHCRLTLCACARIRWRVSTPTAISRCWVWCLVSRTKARRSTRAEPQRAVPAFYSPSAHSMARFALPRTFQTSRFRMDIRMPLSAFESLVPTTDGVLCGVDLSTLASRVYVRLCQCSKPSYLLDCVCITHLAINDSLPTPTAFPVSHSHQPHRRIRALIAVVTTSLSLVPAS